MSGIIEHLIDALRANTAAIMAQGAQGGAQHVGLGTLGYAAQATQFDQAQAAQLQAPQLVQPPPQNITADQITALIQPHVSNESIKAALGAAMRGMGIAGLPETQPHQYGELYQKFSAIIAQATAGGTTQQQQAPASII